MQGARDEIIEAIERLRLAVQENAARNEQIQSRLEWLHMQLLGDAPLNEIVAREARPLVVEMLTSNIETLQAVGFQFRQAEAAALREEGLTIEAIAALFGVTRQRVSALLKS